ncbi:MULTISPECIES: aldo/keto reductase [Bradyrhizobium]|jgi:aryl-alcohol dehydrogenase-like predicted oxidoreductase|uniref:aldo/keto reductase n=1 Tax=Bradyrhizobium TaxID=374 RepID=UPI0004857549|nr:MULTISPECIES: aldo/keto reductase [Bradyrhizobium]MCS3446750.1 aryl-alcohol dehydrogenase-like predicted oxidoreductase [Bradyrhizobium elkanii]MCS3562116.1 aryl-alcohol dehydrogenase-like predicted oxidoreductase [Bradyrhizobium elkanii]MCW2148046.1 aryl-alcohol dehydrogenase-like predicted oxidoreductase [Bradyrhizobium elkanii]MCW2352870.1 aryl-alcohol dehydrogenase-like predicted oxidoreductase [Bradyrhizobium elkanii]MCW2371772.1 aryl-alcohol dehydrogenase-like predicted oxidoreductase
MKHRALGRSGLTVPPLCFGCNVFGWTVDETSSFRLLDTVLDQGLTFLDTADVYSRWVPGHSGGESETIIGKWMKARGNRNRVILATKVGMDMGDGNVGLKPDYIARAVEDSLRRLQTDFIDLYQSHKDDETTPQEETLAAYDKLIKAGKVRAIGASNFSAERLQSALDIAKANGLPRYESMQPEYSLAERSSYEGALQRVCEANDVGVITFFSLAAGFLTGKYRSESDFAKSPRGARSIPKYMNPRGMRILAGLDEVAAETRAEPAAVALAWLMAKPSVTAPIASATRPEQVATLVAATKLELSKDQVERLDAASA